MICLPHVADVAVFNIDDLVDQGRSRVLAETLTRDRSVKETYGLRAGVRRYEMSVLEYSRLEVCVCSSFVRRLYPSLRYCLGHVPRAWCHALRSCILKSSVMTRIEEAVKDNRSQVRPRTGVSSYGFLRSHELVEVVEVAKLSPHLITVISPFVNTATSTHHSSSFLTPVGKQFNACQ